MTSIDLSRTQSLTEEQLHSLAAKWSIKEWQQHAAKLTKDQVASLIPLLTPDENPSSWKEVLHALIDTLSTNDHLEAVGRSLSFEQAAEILSWIAASHDSNRSKLFSLFVGVPSSVFLQLLLHATPEQKALLKQECHLEPIQHHLTVLCQELSSLSLQQNQQFGRLEQQLVSLDLSTVEASQIIEQEKAIEALRQASLSVQLISSKALLLAWNTHRLDLIEKLSSVKEYSQKLSHQFIGIARTQDSPATGLYHLLEERLNSVFTRDRKSIHPDEPALEALVNFSIWYIRDYWEIGLLPEMSDPSELDLDPAFSSEKERIEHREHLFSLVRQNLKNHGLSTLADLQGNRIYSKSALKNYIKNRR